MLRMDEIRKNVSIWNPYRTIINLYNYWVDGILLRDFNEKVIEESRKRLVEKVDRNTYYDLRTMGRTDVQCAIRMLRREYDKEDKDPVLREKRRLRHIYERISLIKETNAEEFERRTLQFCVDHFLVKAFKKVATKIIEEENIESDDLTMVDLDKCIPGVEFVILERRKDDVMVDENGVEKPSLKDIDIGELWKVFPDCEMKTLYNEYTNEFFKENEKEDFNVEKFLIK